MTDDATKTEPPATPQAVAPEEFNKLQSRYDNTYAELVDLKRKFSEFTTLGDPVAVKAKLSDYDNMRKASAGNDKEQIDKLLAEKEQEIHGHWKGKTTELEEKLTQQQQVIRRYTILDPAKTIIGNLFTKDAQELLAFHVEQVADIDGEQVVIKGQDGKPMRSAKDPSRPMGLQEYLEGYAAARPGLALPKGSGGSGAPSGSATGEHSGLSVEAYKAMPKEQREQLPMAVQQALAKQALKTIR